MVSLCFVMSGFLWDLSWERVAGGGGAVSRFIQSEPFSHGSRNYSVIGQRLGVGVVTCAWSPVRLHYWPKE